MPQSATADPLTAADCIALQCPAGYTAAADGCVGCPIGEAHAGGVNASCRPCASGGLCVGVLVSPLQSSGQSWSLDLIRSAPSPLPDPSRSLYSISVPLCSGCSGAMAAAVVRAAALGASTQLNKPAQPPASSTLSSYLPRIIAISVAITVTSVALILYFLSRLSETSSGTSSRIASFAAAALQSSDAYSKAHFVPNGSVIMKRATTLGGVFTWAALGLIIALSLNMIVDNARSNLVTQSAILPLGSTTMDAAQSFSAPSAAIPGWPVNPGLLVVVVGEGQVPGDCALPFGTAITGLLHGSSALQGSPVGSASFINVLSCNGCLFGPGAALSSRLGFRCQNVAVGLATVDSQGAATLIAVNATASSGLLLTGVTWAVQPVLEVCCPMSVWDLVGFTLLLSLFTDPARQLFRVWRYAYRKGDARVQRKAQR